MQKNHSDVAPPCFPADPLDREFPPDWKDVWFRRHAVPGSDGLARYQCPICKKWFDARDIGFLQGDHIWPYSLFGETSWENYRLICGSCNAAKRDYIDNEIRRLLGAGAFRNLVLTYLESLVARGCLRKDARLDEFLGRKISAPP
jgi:hypothetical protein